MTLILHEDDVKRHISPVEAIAVMEKVFLARANHETAGMPRWELPFQEGRITFTVGAVPEGVGFRAYIRGDFKQDEQLVAVWDKESGALKGLVIGTALGVLRTGAIGGVAVKYLAPKDASRLAIIGTGRQALAQLLTIAIVRSLKQVLVYSRNPENRQAFCQEAKKLLPDLNIQATESAEKAVRESEIIVSATTSKTPIVQGDWLLPNAHVSTLGTKGKNTREVDESVVKKAAWVLSDSPEQSRDYPDGTILDESNTSLYDLAEVLSAKISRPKTEGISLFLSSGLAGTEVALAAYLIAKVEKSS
jgi:alanine dehydrogenase